MDDLRVRALQDVRKLLSIMTAPFEPRLGCQREVWQITDAVLITCTAIAFLCVRARPLSCCAMPGNGSNAPRQISTCIGCTCVICAGTC